MHASWRKEVLHWLILSVIVVLTLVGLVQAPERIPVHWNINGEIDRWGSKWFGLLIAPVMAFALYGLLLWIPRFDPARKNYDRFAGAYYVLRLAMLLIMAVIQAAVVAAAVGVKVNTGACIMSAIGLLFVVIGWVMGDIEPNWFVGIRTPWTLTSELSWRKTHRLARWVFVLVGVAFVVGGFYQTASMFFVAIGITVAGVLGLLVYSYFIWKQDPHRLEIPKAH